jgi:hypothetical protein
MNLYQVKRDFASNLDVLIVKDDFLQLFEEEDGVSSFQVIISSFALGAEVCFTAKEIERFLKKIVAT